MKESEKCLLNEPFSHIYIEKAALEYEITRMITKKFSRSRLIFIDHYKDVFCRPNQDFSLQKKTQKLILAVQRNHFLYKSPEICQNFGHPNFYYSSTLLNCLYGCDYCYLQGTYPSAYLTAFVNIEDYFAAVNRHLEREALYLAVSYDTDLLSFEGVIPYTSLWITYASRHPNLTVEIRTKSANFKAISHLEPQSNVILAWTLSPEEVAERYEKRTPPLRERISALKEAADKGWKIRLVFDPVLKVENWRIAYDQLIHQVFSAIRENQIWDVGLGAFRMSGECLKRIRKSGIKSDLLYYPFDCRNQTVRYPEKEEKEMLVFLTERLTDHIDKSKIFIG